MNKLRIGVTGGGNMGAAIDGGLTKVHSVVVCELDTRRANAVKKKYSVKVANLETTVKESDILILAVKPQQFDKLLNKLKFIMRMDQMIISIAAGITSKYIEKMLEIDAKVIRTMPNLPAQIGQGITGLSKGQYAKVKELKLAQEVFNLIGETVLVEEKMLDAVTAVSGSGPAYVFYFVECMQAAAKALKFNDKISKQLVMQTLRGSIELLDSQKDEAKKLRQLVTSKGGTTEAAMKVLTKGKLDKTFKDALKAAQVRAQKLSK